MPSASAILPGQDANTPFDEAREGGLGPWAIILDWRGVRLLLLLLPHLLPILHRPLPHGVPLFALEEARRGDCGFWGDGAGRGQRAEGWWGRDGSGGKRAARIVPPH